MEIARLQKTYYTLPLVCLITVIAIQIIGFTLLWNAITLQRQYVYLPTENNHVGVGTTGEQSASIVSVTKFPTEAVLRNAIQSTLRQELGAHLSQLSTVHQTQQNLPPIDPPDVKENSTENVQAFTSSMSVIETAIASGKWTSEDNIIISQYLPKLTISQNHALREKSISFNSSSRITVRYCSYILNII